MTHCLNGIAQQTRLFASLHKNAVGGPGANGVFRHLYPVAVHNANGAGAAVRYRVAPQLVAVGGVHTLQPVV